MENKLVCDFKLAANVVRGGAYAAAAASVAKLIYIDTLFLDISR